jgi:EAL domain-containing protein (putative c-di-GMP-specific phosphodiesterase class I)
MDGGPGGGSALAARILYIRHPAVHLSGCAGIHAAGSLQLMRDSFVEEVALDPVPHRSGPHLLQVELTESVMLNGAARVAVVMNELTALGVSLAIDDFGMGHSCLSYLPKLPFDALKIDRSFVNDLGVRSEVTAIVRSLVTLAHNFGMRVIAEGVETKKLLAMIAEIGCNEVQGYLLGKPTSDPAAYFRMAEKRSAS